MLGTQQALHHGVSSGHAVLQTTDDSGRRRQAAEKSAGKNEESGSPPEEHLDFGSSLHRGGEDQGCSREGRLPGHQAVCAYVREGGL